MMNELQRNEQWLRKGAGDPVNQLAESLAEQSLDLVIDLAVVEGCEGRGTASRQN